jgi:hypothetical protein
VSTGLDLGFLVGLAFAAGLQVALLRKVSRDVNGVGKRGLKTLCHLMRHASSAEELRELTHIIEGR